MNKNILLLELKHVYARGNDIALSLRKFASYHLGKKDNVIYSNKQPSRKDLFKFKNKKIDKVYITSTFTYDLKRLIKIANSCKRIFKNSSIEIGGIAATLMPDYIKDNTGVNPHIGLYDKIENITPNYSIFPKVQNTTVFTTRGCIRKCGFCAVKILEPKHYICKNWKEQLTEAHKYLDTLNNKKSKRINIQDNNFLSFPFSHQRNVVNFIKDNLNKYPIDFNQALDCRIFKERNASLLNEIKMECLRFAYDDIKETDDFKRSIRISCRVFRRPYIRILMLYGYEDSSKELWERLNVVNKRQLIYPKSEFHVYPMRYQPLDSIEKNKYNPKNWSNKELINFKKLTNLISFMGAIVFRKKYRSKKQPGYIFNTMKFLGRSSDEFIENLNKDLIFKNNDYHFIKENNIKDFLK